MSFKNYGIFAFYLLLMPASAHLITKKTDANGNEIVLDLSQLEQDSLSPGPICTYPVGLIYVDSTEGLLASTVTLISPNLALTTGHTTRLFDKSFLPKDRPSQTRVHFLSQTQTHSSSVIDYFLPKGYDKDDTKLDIGIIKLAENIIFPEGFYTYTLNTKLPSDLIDPDRKFYCLSFSKLTYTENTADSQRLHFTEPRISYDPETASFREEFRVTKQCPLKEFSPGVHGVPSYYCGGTALQFPFTPGDSGSPLIYKEGDVSMLVAIATHWVTAPASASRYHEVNARFYNYWLPLHPHLPWIYEILKSHGSSVTAN